MTTACQLAFACCLLFALVHRANGLRCYSCVSCNDPFSSSGINTVTNTTSGIYCRKTAVLSVVTRDITDSCSSVNVIGNGAWCCQTDLCNGASQLISTSLAGFAVVVSMISRAF